MKISKALNHKNKLVTELNQTFAKIQKYNSVIEGASVPYDVKELVKQYEGLQSEIVRLKVALHRASEPVRDKIFLLSELKSYAKKFSTVSTVNGLVKEHSFRSNGESTTYKATLNEVDIENLVKHTEKQIEALQEELDHFNHTTEVVW